MKSILTIIPVLLFVTSTLFGHKGTSYDCILGDCQNEFSILKYNDGGKYIGELEGGQFSGHGVFYFKDGSKYIGSWKNHNFHGNGKFYYKDGRVKSGIWEKGEMIKKMVSKSGCISGNCEEGYGVYVDKSGRKHISFKERGKPTRSIIYYGNGSKYIGATKGYKRQGTGVLYQADGVIETGVWSDDRLLGTVKQGKGCVSGNCNNGVGTYIYHNNTRYYGSFNNSLANGKGICYYADGDVYVGFWKDHSFHGKGTLYSANGDVKEGRWDRGEYLEKPEVYYDFDTQNKQTNTTKVWAVLVGVSSYKHMKPLRFTDDDAYRLHSFLKSPEGGAISDDRMHILVDESASKQNILKKLRKIASRAGKDDCVLFYFSGHGIKGSFLPIDYNGTRNKLHHDEIQTIFNSSKAKTKILIADACHSGSFGTRAKNAEVNNTLGQYYKALSATYGGTALLLSSKAEETSIESNGLRQGIFSHFLIRGLKGSADENTDKVVTIQELFRYVEANVNTYTNGYQTPVISGKYDKNIPLGVVR